MNILGFFQRLGRALRFPIVVLPVAALLLRFGQPDLPDVAFTAWAGGTIFDNPTSILAIGVASSRSKDSAGAATLASVVGYSVLIKATVTVNPKINMSVLAGIITGLAGGIVYNRWSDIKLPDFLSSFDGRHFVPIATDFLCLMLAAILSHVWPPVRYTIHADGEWIVSADALGFGIFGFVNRLLIPTGLHQVLSTIAWLQIGKFINAAGAVFHGDTNRFYAGDGTVGMFMLGFFPIMMFGSPGAALAMYFAAPKERRLMAGGMLLSVTITAFLAGMIKSLEFLFMFLAPLLHLLHALLIDTNLFVATLLGIHVGFSFSAEAVDCVLMYDLPAVSQNAWMLLAMGVVFFAICFAVFSLVICMSNLRTPGREDKGDEIVAEEANSNAEENLNQLATNYIAAIGGTDNLKAIDTCITRLRLTVVDSVRVNDAMCKRLGTSGVMKLDRQTIQVTVGAKTEFIGDVMKKVVARGLVAVVSAETTPVTVAPAAKLQAVPNAASIAELVSPITGGVITLNRAPNEAFASKVVGDGVAAKSTDKIIVSSIVETIVKIFNTNHASCLETRKGAEIVVHIGIDTVALEGKGFKRLVEEGAQISAGQPVLEMDLDCLNVNARSMISPMVCNSIDSFSGLIIKAQGHTVAGQTPLYEIKK